MKKSLAVLLASFPSPGETAEDLQVIGNAYLLAVEGIPEQFVGEAVKDFVQGRVERSNHHYRPSPPELAIYARELEWEAHREAMRKKHEEIEARRETIALVEPQPFKHVLTEQERREHVKRALGRAVD